MVLRARGENGGDSENIHTSQLSKFIFNKIFFFTYLKHHIYT